MKIYLAVFLIAFGILNTVSAHEVAKSDLMPLALRAEYKVTPFTDVERPRLSWELFSAVNNQVQTAYEILVASSLEILRKDKGDLWASGKIQGNTTNQVEYRGNLLLPGQSAYWKIRSWDKNGVAGKWSEPSSWETGLLAEKNWKASWIGYDLTQYGKGKKYHLPPATYFRKVKHIKRTIKSARLYITALGLYEFYINGQRIGEDYFTPGWTDYNKRVYYQAYDITPNLLKGDNVFASTLSYGWYAGYLGYAQLVGSPTVRGFYGNVPMMKSEIRIQYTDGSSETIASDNSWKASGGPLIESDILHGETYDARLELDGWEKPAYNDAAWVTASVYANKPERLVQLYPGNPIKVFTELPAKKTYELGNGKYIIDFGQNFAGIVRINMKGQKGDSVILRYGEMLHPNGALMTENLRMARATDTYILKGNPQGESWSPQFTYHGFQYVEVSGLRHKPEPDFIKGIVLTSSTPTTGAFETDHPMLNQLYKNIVWTQRANYFDIPTDCPQRDERLGWTGDAQIYMKSAVLNNDISAFHTKWITDLNDAQWASGAYPTYAPMPVGETGKAAIRADDTFSPGWYEAGIVCPYEIYRTYGDTRIIKDSWPNMIRFMDFLKKRTKETYVFKEGSFVDIAPRGGYGDWLSIGLKTPPELLATLYYGYCTSMMEELATAIGKKEAAVRFSNEHAAIMRAFKNHYIDPAGKFITDPTAYGNGDGYVDGNMGFSGHTQTAYANAIYLNMLDSALRVKAGDWLMALLRKNGNSITTGFLGFKPLLPALSATGNADMAYRLLLSTEYPSLGYEVKNGATSIWERWDSYTHEEGFKENAGMNSFSHYAFGAVNEWMFGNMAGIKTADAGFRHIIIKPEIAHEGVNYVQASYHSINGLISSSWRREGKVLHMEVTVPVNTHATVYVPARQRAEVHHVGSGVYKFTTTL